MALNIILFGVVIVTSTGHVAMHFCIFFFLLPSSLLNITSHGSGSFSCTPFSRMLQILFPTLHLYDILFPFNNFSMVEELLLAFNLKVSANPSFFFLSFLFVSPKLWLIWGSKVKRHSNDDLELCCQS